MSEIEEEKFLFGAASLRIWETRENHRKCDNKNEIYDLRLVIYLCANLLLQMVHVLCVCRVVRTLECTSARIGRVLGVAHGCFANLRVVDDFSVRFHSFCWRLFAMKKVIFRTNNDDKDDINIDTFCFLLHDQDDKLSTVSFLKKKRRKGAEDVSEGGKTIIVDSHIQKMDEVVGSSKDETFRGWNNCAKDGTMCDIEKPLNFNKTYIFYIKNVAVVFHSAHSSSLTLYTQ